jgi:hypothetical protein
LGGGGMDFREMLSKRPQFEVKYINEDHWEKLSEKDALLNLHKAYAMITPIHPPQFIESGVGIKKFTKIKKNK